MWQQKKQHGMTGIGWILALALIAFFALLALRIAPIMMEAYKVRKSLDSLQQEPFITKKENKEILTLLFRRLEVNDVNSVKNEHVTIQREAGVITIRIKYENRKPFLGNFSIVADYDEVVKVVQN